MSWLDSVSASYLAWAWNADFNCSSRPSLITGYSVAPDNWSGLRHGLAPADGQD